MRNASWLPWSAGLASLLLAACAHMHPPVLPWDSAQQMVLVTTPGWNADHGVLRRFQRNARGWALVGTPQPVMIGRSGSAWGLGLNPTQTDGPIKREGDGRSPAGVFGIGEAFGYAPATNTALQYQATQASDYCVDVSGSPLYNHIVDSRNVGEAAVAGATEPMRRDLHADGDQRYRLGFVIEHNTQGQPMGGSCIFAHLWKSSADATTGCTAMDPRTMEAALAWLNPAMSPIFVLLPKQEYLRLQTHWQLPADAVND